MAKTLLAWMREVSGSAAPRIARNPVVADGLLRRLWPILHRCMFGALLSVALIGGLLVEANLLDRALYWRAFLSTAGAALAFGIGEEILERLRLIDKTTSARPRLRLGRNRLRPPPIQQVDVDAHAAPSCDDGREGFSAQGAVPPPQDGSRPPATWTLEGEYRWRRSDAS